MLPGFLLHIPQGKFGCYESQTNLHSRVNSDLNTTIYIDRTIFLRYNQFT